MGCAVSATCARRRHSARRETTKHQTMIRLRALICSGLLTKTEEARNQGSVSKRHPRSTPPCSLEVVVHASSERSVVSRTVVPTIPQAFRNASCSTCFRLLVPVATMMCHSSFRGLSSVRGRPRLV